MCFLWPCNHGGSMKAFPYHRRVSTVPKQVSVMDVGIEPSGLALGSTPRAARLPISACWGSRPTDTGSTPGHTTWGASRQRWTYVHVSHGCQQSVIRMRRESWRTGTSLLRPSASVVLSPLGCCPWQVGWPSTTFDPAPRCQCACPPRR
jgi:hypothetical protein